MSLMIDDSTSKEFLVTEECTATAVGSGGLPVLGTPVLVAWVEELTYNFLQDSLDAGMTSVGGYLDVTHINPTPVGWNITIYIKVKSKHKQRFTFEYYAEDKSGIIAKGTHSRVVVSTDNFLNKVKSKSNGSI